MSTELIVAGEMGKGGGGTESKDTLISEQTVKTLFAVGEGLIDSVETVYLDTVEITNFDADFEYRTGTGAQTVVDGFTVTESPLPGFTAKNIIRDSTKKNGEELPNVSLNITVNATALVANNWYKITSAGTTNWKDLGSPNNNNGQVFKATKAGTGNGVAVQMNPVFQVPETIVSIPYEEAMKSVRASFTFSALTKTDGDGNIVGSTVVFEVYTRHNSTNGIWSLYKSKQWTVKGKTTHGYTFDLELPRPDTATSASPWQIKVIRITPDSGTVKKQDTMQWSAVTQLYHSTLSYNNTALAAVVLRDAMQFGNRIPEIMFKVKGKKIKLPNNYTPGTSQAVGTYTGNWTGTFATYLQYSNNPAWILYDVLTDTRAGLGIPEADLDKYSFYNLGKYCDEPLANGYSEPIVCRDNGEVLQEAYALTIPRFTLDYSFQTREGVKDFLSQILSICNANLITNEFGQLAVIFQQRGQVVKRLVTNSNVIDGVFTYQSSNIEQRTNLVNVTYNRGLNFGRTDTVTVSEDSLITRYGLRPLDIVLPGCYHETQAIRKARWALYSNCYFTDFITFSVLLDGMTYKIGDLIKVIDEYNRPDQFQAVITTVSTANGLTSVTLDRTITITEGSYTFLCMDTAGNEITKTITAPAGFNSVDFAAVQSISVGTIAVVSKSTPKIYRITSITKDENQAYSVTALEFDEAIFDYVDGTVSLSPKTGDFAGVGQFGTLPVSGIAVKENFGTNGVYTTGRLQVSWQWDTEKTQKYRANFKLTYTVDDGVPTIINTITSDTYDIMNPIPGVYTISVWAVNSFTNIYSPVTTYSYSFRVAGANSTLLHPINVRIAGTTAVSPQPTLLNFSTPELTLAFDYNPANQNVEDALYDYLVEIWDEAGLNLIESYAVNPITGLETVDPIDENLLYKPLNGTFALPFNRNVNIFGGTAARTFKVKIYSRDTIGDLSLPVVVTVSNPVPVFTSFTITPDFGKVRVDIAASSEIDVRDYFIHRGTTANFVPSADNLFYKGPSNTVSLTTPDTADYFYKCAISDSFGSDNLNYSTAQSAHSTVGGADFVTISGEQFFSYAAGSTTPRNPSITLTATLHGSLTTYLWRYWNGSGWSALSGTNNGSTYILASDNTAWGTAKILRISCLSGELAGEITISKVSDGAQGPKGDQGYSPALFGIDNASAVFRKSSVGVISPTSLTLTTSFQNITGTPTYQWKKNDVNITGATSSSYSVPTGDYSSVNSNSYTVMVTGTINGTSGTLSDTITIPLLEDGGSGPTVVLSNENITFGAPNTGYTGVNFSNGTCDITAYIGSTQLTYAATGANTFSLTASVTGATVGAGATQTANIFRIPAPTAISAESAVVTLTITIRDSSGNALSSLITKTLRYNLSRAGQDSTSYWLTTTNFLRRSSSLVYTPAALTVSGYRQVGSAAPALYSCRFKIYENGSATASYTSAADENTYNYTPSGTAVNQIKVEMYLAGGTTTLIDYSTIPVVQDGSNALTLVEPNSAVVLPADNAGTVSSYTNSGTTIKVFEGSAALTYTTGVVTKGQFTVSVAVSGITAGTTSGNGSSTFTIGNHSGMTTDSATVTYTVNVVKWDGVAVTLTDTQVLTKSKAGAQGSTGTSTYLASIYYNGIISTAPTGGSYNFTNNTLTAPAGWSIVPYASTTTGTSVSTQLFTSSNGGASVSWSTPVLYSKSGIDGGPGSPGTAGTSVYTATVYLQQASTPTAPSGGSFNFSTATLTAPSGWTITQPTSSIIPIFSSKFTFSTTTPGTTVTGGTWSTPVTEVQNGTNGTAGKSAVRAYQLTTSAGTSPTFNTSSTNGTTPGAAWSFTQTSPSTGQFQWQIDGIADYATGTTTWTQPYLSVFKVDTLNAFTTNTGALNVTGKLSVATSGVIASGMSGFSDGTGYWLEYNAGTPRFALGKGSGALVASSITAGMVCTITNLGTGTDWNAIAGTTGITYANGNTFKAVTAGAGTGTVREIEQGIMWDGTTFGIAGNVIGTANINVSAVSEVTTYNISTNLNQPTASAGLTLNTLIITGASGSNSGNATTVFNATVPSVSISTKRTLLINLQLRHADSTPGSYRILVNGTSIGDSTATARIVDTWCYDLFSVACTVTIAANSTTFPTIEIMLINSTAGSLYWNAGILPTVTGTVTLLTGKR